MFNLKIIRDFKLDWYQPIKSRGTFFDLISLIPNILLSVDDNTLFHTRIIGNKIYTYLNSLAYPVLIY